MKIKLYLLDCHLDSMELLKYYIHKLVNTFKLECYVLPPLYSDDGGGGFSSRFFNLIELHEIESPSRMIETLGSRKSASIVIYKGDVKHNILDQIGINVDSVADKTESYGYPITSTYSIINPQLADNALASVLNIANLREGSKTLPLTRTVTSVAPKLFLIFATEIAQSDTGTGMGNHKSATIKLMYRICKDLGYDMVVAHEDDIDSLSFSSSDIVHGVSVGGLYAGSYTANGFGFRMHNLLTLAKKAKKLTSKPIVACSLHASESRLIGSPTLTQKSALQNIMFSSFTDNGLHYLKEIGLPTTDKAFPIMATFRRSFALGKGNTQTKQLLLQVDTQTRKNGELALMAVIDAFAIAKRRRSSLALNVICKSSAAYHYPSEQFLKHLVINTGLKYPEPIPNLRLLFQHPVGLNEWNDTMDRTDIALFLSIEEGIHLFVGEVWSRGAFCVFADNPSYTRYKELGNGVGFLPTIEVPYGGAGKHNDMFDSLVRIIDYNKGINLLSNIILNESNAGGRDIITTYDTDGSVTGKLLGMRSSLHDSKMKVEFTRSDILKDIRL